MTDFFHARLGHKRGHKVLHLGFIIYAIGICLLGVKEFVRYDEWWLKSISELFNNYAGGFVRRGLLGTLLIELHHATGIHPYAVISVSVVISYAILAWYFFKKFRQRGYCWYFLVTCLMLGSIGTYGLMMRRILLVVLFLCVVQLLKRARPYTAFIIGNILTILALLCYEPYFFFSVPIFILLTHAIGGSWKRAFAVWLPSIITFCACSLFHGNPTQFAVMKEVAEPYIGSEPFMLNFIQWSFTDIAQYHWKLNYIACPYYVPSILVNIFAIVYVLYLGTNGVTAFERPSETTRRQTHTLFGLVAFQLVMQMPMFVILSTDYGRICCFSVMTAYITYLTFDNTILARLFPERVTSYLHALCERMNHILVPKRTLIVCLMLFVGVSSWQGNIFGMELASIAGQISRIAYTLALKPQMLLPL